MLAEHAQAGYGYALLDTLPEPVATVSRSGHVKNANAAFERLTNNAIDIKLSQGTIVCGDPATQRRLRQALSQAHALAFREPIANGRMTLTFTIPDGRHNLRVSVAPIPPAFGVHGSDAPGALIKMVVPSLPPDPAVLIRSLGLTSAETRLACELMSGGRGPEIAKRLGISLNTVNTQLAGIYGKTKTNCRADLMVLLAGLPR